MTRKLFGTDGVRGEANVWPMTAEMALKLGAAAGRYFRRDGRNGHRVVIGKDTRLSGYMLENALTAGLTSTGMNVLLLGPVPTPAVGFLTRSMRADLGIMISASHNPADDNGIKFLAPMASNCPTMPRPRSSASSRARSALPSRRISAAPSASTMRAGVTSNMPRPRCPRVSGWTG